MKYSNTATVREYFTPAKLDPTALVLDAKDRERSQVLKFKIPQGISSISDNAPAIPEHTICARGILFQRWNSTITILLGVCVFRASASRRGTIVINVPYANSIIYIYNTYRTSKYNLCPTFVKLLRSIKNITFQLRDPRSSPSIIIDLWVTFCVLIITYVTIA